MHATDFTRKRPDTEGLGIAVLHGSERHLKTVALNALCELVLDSPPDQAMSLVRLPGKETEFKTLRDELAMVSMFSDRKLVFVEDADDFVTKFRSQLENYAEKPSRRSLLVLELKTWRKNTRLAKKVDKEGLEIDCSELEGGQLSAWLIQQAQEIYDKHLTRDAAQLMTELAGTGMGQLHQEIGKLAAYVGDGKKIGADDVRTLVGGWKAETTWRMIDSIRDGKVGVALTCLNKLLYAGEPAPKILGGINYVFRKFAVAIETSRQGRGLRESLQQSGVFPRDIGAAEQYLRRLSRPRAERILERLAQADYGIKGGSRVPEHLQLEQLVLWLAGVQLSS